MSPARTAIESLVAGIDVRDPYPLWQSLLAQPPIVAPDGRFALLSRRADIDAVLRHPAASADRRRSTRWAELTRRLSPADLADLDRSRVFLFQDPPDHTRLRSLVSKAFTPRVVAGLVPLVEQLCRDLLDAAARRGRLELVADLAHPLPVAVISRMLGVPDADQGRFTGWSAELAQTLGDSFGPVDSPEWSRRRAAGRQFRDYIAGLAELRRSDPTDDLISGLVAAEQDGDRLSPDELCSTVMLLLVAGHETTVNLLANGWLALLRRPDLRGELAADPSLADGIVEEVLRMDPPVQLTMRIAAAPLAVPGGTVAPGGALVLALAAAGRDPAAHRDPAVFDPRRSDGGHLAFSAGPHYCLGAALARLEARVVLTRLAQRLVDPSLQRLDYRDNRVLRGPAVLEVGYTRIA